MPDCKHPNGFYFVRFYFRTEKVGKDLRQVRYALYQCRNCPYQYSIAQ